MKIALFGATGMIGQRILAEARSRGHEVTVVARHPIDSSQVSGDVFDDLSVAKVAVGHDVLISAYGPGQEDPERLVDAAHSLIAGVRAAGPMRLMVVSGAGSLEVAPGVRLVDAPGFPEAWKGLAAAHAAYNNVPAP